MRRISLSETAKKDASRDACLRGAPETAAGPSAQLFAWAASRAAAVASAAPPLRIARYPPVAHSDAAAALPRYASIDDIEARMSGARAVIKSSTMVQDELEEAIKVSTMALHSTNSEQEAAAQIKQTFEQRTNRTWHCLVGRNFACYVTYESKSFAYFYIGQQGVCLFCTD